MRSLKYGSEAIGEPGSLERAQYEYLDVMNEAVRLVNFEGVTVNLDRLQELLVEAKAALEEINKLTRAA